MHGEVPAIGFLDGPAVHHLNARDERELQHLLRTRAGAEHDKARAVAGDGPTYVSFDIDSLDPAFAPGTGTPEVGGLTTREALAILAGMKGLDIIGGDVVEVAPQYDTTTNTAQAGAQMLFEILSLMVYSPSIGARKG